MRLPGQGSRVPHPFLLWPAEMEPRHVSPEEAVPLSGEVLKPPTWVSRTHGPVCTWCSAGRSWAGPSGGLFLEQAGSLPFSQRDDFWFIFFCLWVNTGALFVERLLFCYFNRSFSGLFGWSYVFQCTQSKASWSSGTNTSWCPRQSAFVTARQHSSWIVGSGGDQRYNYLVFYEDAFSLEI